MEPQHRGAPYGSRGESTKPADRTRTGNPRGRFGRTRHVLTRVGHVTRLLVSARRLFVKSTRYRTYHSTLYPVSHTIAILHNTCATHFKLREVSTINQVEDGPSG